jgi:hypothetical protein
MEKFKKWIAAAGVRALKTFAQTAASLITVGTIMSEINWAMVFSSAGVAAIYSLLTSIGGLPEIKLEEKLEEEEEENKE